MRMKQNEFLNSVIKIALPVTLQTLLQSSFSVIDQVMIGQLGSRSIAGVGLGGKFSSLYSVLLGAVAAAAGIMISQYMGQKNEKEVSRSFYSNFLLALGLGAVFLLLCVCLPKPIMHLYTRDEKTAVLAAEYLRTVSFSYLPMAVSSIAAVLLRCAEAAALPLYAGIVGVALNTGLNYLLIFGRWGFPEMGVKGAAWASVISQAVSCILTVFMLMMHQRKHGKILLRHPFQKEAGEETPVSRKKEYFGILLPIILCEFLWSLGENVYTAIYGNIGTEACAAMTLTVPVQTVVIGALSGLSQAAGILIGKSLGSREYEKAYEESKKLMIYGLWGSLGLSAVLLGVKGFYVNIYQVESQVRSFALGILTAFAVIAPVKVQNMILGGGIIRSGGKTKYVMWIDFIGTWFFGVPLGLLAAFVWKLPIPWVYFILSLEECVRLGISLVIFRKKIWMKSLGEN